VGRRSQSFEINKLEMVDQICPRWNRLPPWFELVGAFKDAAQSAPAATIYAVITSLLSTAMSPDFQRFETITKLATAT
jgi:hypothetical protein